MAGLYPDAPGFKMQYDVDGTACFYDITSGTGVMASPRSLTSGEATTLNSETGTAITLPTGNGDNTTGKVGLIFAQTRDIVGVNNGSSFGGNTNGQSRSMETSVDTTNGRDGTWVTQTVPVFSANYRTGIQTYSISAVKAVRFSMTMGQSFPSANWAQIHVYGNITTGQSPDRLRIWNPTLDQEIGAAALDFGDFGRGGTITKTFRIKNNSSSLTANSIVLSTSVLTDTSPAVLSQLTLSQGSGFASTQNIGNLAPSAISAVCTLSLASTSSETLSLWRQRLVATAGSWT